MPSQVSAAEQLFELRKLGIEAGLYDAVDLLDRLAQRVATLPVVDTPVELRVLVGVPACGKSTLANRWLEEGKVDAIVSSDGIRKEITGSEENFDQEDLVWATVKARIDDHLRRGRTVVLDATNLLPEYRKAWIEIGEAANVPVIAYRVAVPWGVVHLRNQRRRRTVPDDVMRQMWTNWVDFSCRADLEDEGFEVVIDIDG